jgi:FkbM family methyltransferase
MSKLIYSCIFFREDYLDLADLLLESYARYPLADTKYLIITGLHYKERVEALFDKHGIDGDTWCLNIFTQFDATAARLHIFSYPDLDSYDQLLYLDCDILITNPLEPIFDIDLEEKLYCFNQDITLNDWGRSKQLFVENNADIDFDRSVFSTCIILFKNCERIRSLFKDILDHIAERVPGDYDLDGAYEEDFVIYQCFIQDCYDDVHLTKYTRSNCLVEDKKMIFNHFCAMYKILCAKPDGKLDRMHLYLSRVDKNYSRNIIHVGANKGDCPTTKAIQYEPYHSVSINDSCVFVEPIPYLFEQLKENYDKKYPGNSFIFINKAVSNFTGEVEMIMASQENNFDEDGLGLFPYCSSIDLDFIARHEKIWNTKKVITEKITVPTITLNELVKGSGMKEIDLMIIDAEGHDFKVLMPYDFSIRPKTLIFEHHMIKEGDLAILLSRLMSMGYKQVGIGKLDIILEYSR